MPAAGISQVLSQISAKKISLRRRGGGVGRAQAWDRVHVSRGVLFPLLPFGIKCYPQTWEYCYPLPAGFPRNRSPLKGNPPFRGTPSALGHDGVRGRRLHGAAMLCRLQCARFAKGQAASRSEFSLDRLRKSVRRVQARSELDNVVSGDVTFGGNVRIFARQRVGADAAQE